MHLKRTFIFLLFIAACALSAVSCRTETVLDPPGIDAAAARWHDLACFLAGMPLPVDSRFHTLAANPEYQTHVKWMNDYWERVKKENIDLITPWRNSQMPRATAKNPAFYPLCGGDFVNLYTFYPEARSYLMIALERAGAVPDPLKLQPQQLWQGLGSVRRVIWSIASINYFVSSAMRAEMINRYMDGTTPVLLIFAARLGLTVTNVQSIGLDASGEVLPLDEKGLLHGMQPVIKGTRIMFLGKDDRAPRELLYLSMRLEADSFDKQHYQGPLLRRLTRLNTFIKSAIYLLHLPSYQHTCEMIVERSNVVVTDDSGAPYRYFNKDSWVSRLYGIYTIPPKLREIPHPPRQDDLARDFETGSHPLPFKFGYGVLRKDGRSNLMLMTRRNPLP